MSDLAPFVASVLRDRTMIDMIAEMEKLKCLVEDRFEVQITGRKGSPVYFEGSLKNGYTSHRGRCYEVMFDDDDEDNDDTATKSSASNPSPGRVLRMDAVNGIEIRLGGVIIQRLDLDSVVGSCNSPFFTDDNFYRDTKYNRPIFLAPDRKEIVLKVKTRYKGVPFVLARFGDEMDLEQYRKLGQLNMPDLKKLADSKKGHTLILEGVTLSRQDIRKSLSILKELGYSVDTDNSHCRRSAINATKLPSQKKVEAATYVAQANAAQ